MSDGLSKPPSAARRLLPSLALLAITIVISLLLAEGLVRLVGAMGLVDVAPTLAEVPLPEEIANEVRFDAAGSEDPLYVGDALLHHHMAPNWSGTFPEEIMNQVGRSTVPIRTNSLGLRGDEVLQPKPPDLFRILVLGDSVTFGWGVREEDTYSSQLAGLLAALRPGQRFEVINAGVSGYGTWQEALWLRQAIDELAPDLVVVQVHVNDAADNLWGTLGQRSRSSSWLVGISALARLVDRVLLARQVSRGSGGTCDRDWQEGTERVCWQTTLDLLADVGESAQGHGADVVVLPSPMRWQVESGVNDPRAWIDGERFQAVMADFAQRQGMLAVDPLPEFRSAAGGSGQSLFLDVGHPNEAGHRLMAQELYRVLSQAGALP